MTPAECRSRLHVWLVGRGGWVPVAEVAEFLRGMGLSRSQGYTDLRRLRQQGRVERRDSRTVRSKHRRGPAGEYRAAPGSVKAALEGWWLERRPRDAYQDPVTVPLTVVGTREDGETVRTSGVVYASGCAVLTTSGSCYRLGTPDRAYARAMAERGKPVDPSDPFGTRLEGVV